MKYLTLGLAATILSFTAVSASPAPTGTSQADTPDAGMDYSDYSDLYDDLDTRALPAAKPAPAPAPKPDSAGSAGNGTETAQEQKEDKLWDSFDKALDQNECARNNPHSFDQKRISKECTDMKGKLQTVKVDNKSPITYVVMPTALPKNPKQLPKPTTSTYAPGKAELFVCDCTSTKVPTIPTGAL